MIQELHKNSSKKYQNVKWDDFLEAIILEQF